VIEIFKKGYLMYILTDVSSSQCCSVIYLYE